MAKLVVLYRTPKDSATFDAYYAAAHVPLAKRIPGLRSYEISNGPVMTPADPADVHLVAEFGFETIDALMSASARRRAGPRRPTSPNSPTAARTS